MCVALNGRMAVNDDLRRRWWEDAVVNYFKVLFRNLPRRAAMMISRPVLRGVQGIPVISCCLLGYATVGTVKIATAGSIETLVTIYHATWGHVS
jgi:hypothetical protein